LADGRLRATPEQLCDALGACTELNVVYRRLLKMALQELRLIDEQICQLDHSQRNAGFHHRLGICLPVREQIYLHCFYSLPESCKREFAFGFENGGPVTPLAGSRRSSLNGCALARRQ
jgi:hypothetical protein